VTTDSHPHGRAPASREDGTTAPGQAPAPTELTSVESIVWKPDWPEPKVLRVWAATELWIACAVLVVLVLSVLWQVISRFAPALNWPGVGELANYSLIVMTFIMVGYLIGNNGHITIQIIDYVAKGRVLVVVKVVSAAFTALICALLVWEAFGLIQAYPTRRTAALEIPVWTLYVVPLVGFASGAVRAVVRIFLANRPDVMFDAAEAR
jgi:TRAP-type C4-dicarboxylate transport system permease small subunit